MPNVPPKLNDKIRRSYVLWREHIAPLIALEFAEANGEEERDKTPFQGRYWVYEQVMRIPFYGIYEVNNAKLEVIHLVEGFYQQLRANERGHYPIAPLGVELGLWQGSYQNQEFLWLRWWDLQGNLLLIGEERAEQERHRAEQERYRAEQAEQRAAQLAERLRAIGIDPDVENLD